MKKFFSDEQRHAGPAWLMFFIGIAIILWVISLPGCKSSMPPIDVSFWAGDSAKDGVTRTQENKTIECKDPEFDELVCLTYEDVKKIFAVLLQCEQWPRSATLVKTDKLLRRLEKHNPEVANYVTQHYRRDLKP